MKTISIDIETYSGTDLGKCGVYKYTEDLDFEVLLFGYAVDGGEVHVVDLALGEKIPADIAASLTDENVLKFAFNANFERVCLSRHLGMPTGEYLDPSSWRCTMVWAAYMGLPLSLQGVGAVLNLDKQKLTEGKELIKYFCSPCAPTKSNGGRTRNRPEDAPEKWSLFKSYNLRDVETEMGIQQKLTKFPVPEFVWDEYHIDQEINDRGVRLDIPLVDTAIRMDAASRQELMDDMRRITELENPNSVAQMRSWLADNGLETDMKRTLSLLLTLCMLLGCMTVGVMAAEPAVTTARGSAANPIPVYSNKADNSYGNVTLDVDATVSDDGVLTFYDYGTVKSNGFVYLSAESNNEKVATVEGSYEGGTLKLTFTGVADGVATVTVDYSCTTYGGSDSIYGEHSGAALGKLYYTVKVGTGSSTPVTPDQPGEGPTYDKDGYLLRRGRDHRLRRN